MPALMEQVNRMSTDEKLRLVECIIKSISMTVESSGHAATTASAAVRRSRPRISDFIGYARRFHPEYRSTEDVMRELREGDGE